MAKTLGTFVRERRQDLGLTQEELGSRIGDGLTQSEISRLETDRVSLPRRDRLEQVAIALDVSLGDLLLHTGWMREGDELATELQAGTPARQGTYGQPDHGEQDVTAVVETLAALQDIVVETSQKLEQANGTIASLMRALNVECNTRGIIRPRAGLLKDWETTAVLAT